MKLNCHPYTPDHLPAVDAFNKRLRATGSELTLNEQPPESSSLILATDQSGIIHGGLELPQRSVWINNTRSDIGWIKLLLTESSEPQSINKRLISYAVEHHPDIYGVIDTVAQPDLSAALTDLGFTLKPMPHFFRVCHPKSYLKNLSRLRENPAWRVMTDVAAATGVGALGILSLQASRRKKRTRLGRLQSEVTPGFDLRFNDIHENAVPQYSFTASRDNSVLTALFPPDTNRVNRLLVTVDSTPVGFAVVTDRPMKDHPRWGNMYVGTILDTFAVPEQADAVITAATDFLEDRGVDLVVTWQVHPYWTSALASTGFLSGPPDLTFTLSPSLRETIETLDDAFTRLHLTAADNAPATGL